jgi:hypothetical protein
LRISVPRSVGGRHESQVRPHRAALLEAVGILQGEHERERRERPDPLDLPQELGLWVALLGDRLQLSVVLTDALRQRSDLLQDRSEGRPKRLGDVL